MIFQRSKLTMATTHYIGPRRTPQSSLLLFLALLSSCLAYPAIIQVDDKSQRCFRFNIPEDDDANIVAIVLPNEDEIGKDSALESWLVDQAYKITKAKDPKRQTLPPTIPDEPSSEVAQAMSKYLQDNHGDPPNVQFQMTGTPMSKPDTFPFQRGLQFFQPLVVNAVSRTVHARGRHRGDNNMEGYGICIENRKDDKQVQVIFDMILWGDDVDDDDAAQQQRFAKETHLSPLESSLDQSIRSAESVLREMKFMEKRESRMRKTSDSINMRVRWFAYLSISVLFSVTYIQVTYLKRYFQKKKLM